MRTVATVQAISHGYSMASANPGVFASSRRTVRSPFARCSCASCRMLLRQAGVSCGGARCSCSSCALAAPPTWRSRLIASEKLEYRLPLNRSARPHVRRSTTLAKSAVYRRPPNAAAWPIAWPPTTHRRPYRCRKARWVSAQSVARKMGGGEEDGMQ